MMPHMLGLLGWPLARRLNGSARPPVTWRPAPGAQVGLGEGVAVGVGGGAGGTMTPLAGVGAAHTNCWATFTTTWTLGGSTVTCGDPVTRPRVYCVVVLMPLMLMLASTGTLFSLPTVSIGPVTVTKGLGWTSTPVMA